MIFMNACLVRMGRHFGNVGALSLKQEIGVLRLMAV